MSAGPQVHRRLWQESVKVRAGRLQVVSVETHMRALLVVEGEKPLEGVEEPKPVLVGLEQPLELAV